MKRASTSRSLLSIPAEVRLRIYQHYLKDIYAFVTTDFQNILDRPHPSDDDHTEKATFKFLRSEGPEDYGLNPCELNLTQTCKMIRSELLPVISARVMLDLSALEGRKLVSADMSCILVWYVK